MPRLRFLITGHTGFKGSWLTLLLAQMGHSVSGVALDPEPDSLFQMASVGDLLAHDIRSDIRDASIMPALLAEVRPEVLIHLAAQPLVRESYRNPRFTIETNVMGTLNVLEAAAVSDSLRAQLVVTTDKVYRNGSGEVHHGEQAPLGGRDPYSASKAMADILACSWSRSFSGPPTAIARAGNVIGGGDFGKERLIPDLIRALTTSGPVLLRYPQAVRPWQHVLDCLDGYLTIISGLLASDTTLESGEVWNIGPGSSSVMNVLELSNLVADLWGSRLEIQVDPDESHETGVLLLDSTKAAVELAWTSRLDLETSVSWTVDWYRLVAGGHDPRLVTMKQIGAYLSASTGTMG